MAAIQSPIVLLQATAGQAISSGTLDVIGNISQLTQYVDFYNNRGGRILQPAYGLGLVLLAVVGIAHLLSTKYTAKSYIMAAWVVLTIPILIINPEAAAVALLPVSLLSAFAIDFLIRRWYTMFPRNPYARVTGLIPLGILVLVLSVSSMDRFIYGYRYDPEAVKAYSSDVRLLQNEIDSRDNQMISLVVAEQDQAFYRSFIAYNGFSDHVKLIPSQVGAPKTSVIIVSGEIHKIGSEDKVPMKIIVSQTTEDANRFYVYENGAA